VILFRFHPEARLEARSATLWYRERSRDAARSFAAVLVEGIQAIREHPEAWPPWSGRSDVRCRVVRRFPYSLLYILEPTGAVIVAVAHHRRQPDYWLSRLQP